MKLHKTILTGGLILLCLFSLSNIFKEAFPPSQVEEQGRILAFRELTLLPTIDKSQLEYFAAEYLTPTFKNQVPGVESYIIRGQRGAKKGVYVHLLVFDSERTRNFYFPFEDSGESEIKGEALRLWRPGQIMLLDSLPKYVESLEEAIYTDYVFVE